ncbi:ATP-binding protein [Sphaerisporangium dianthi]|uniref:ATP-binding protein n=1 Tax=Sphaerisporangium dianthi TaxID=1436120 RepID=A0ABV9CJ94_9ACTN
MSDYEGRTMAVERPGKRDPDDPFRPARPIPANPHTPFRAAPTAQAPDGPRTVWWDLPDDPAMIGKTRAMVKEVLDAWALRPLTDDVVLVVTELLANAMTYGRPPVRLTIDAEDDELRVQVTDRGSERPRRLRLDVEAIHGRGLTIVEHLADAYGITPLTDAPGKTVWATWRLNAPRLP